MLVPSRIWSCRRLDTNETSGHGYEAFSQRFVPSNCALKGFDPFDFMNTLRNRHLAMVGDSVTLQFYTLVVCSLHGTMEAKYNLTWKDFSNLFGPDDCPVAKHCHLLSSSVYYPHYNTTITLHMEYGHRSFLVYYNRLQLTAKDIVIFNRGLHVREAERMQGEVRSLFDEYLNMPESHQPMLIWRETSPQHFHSPNGYFNWSIIKHPCHRYYNATKAYLEDYRNRFVDDLFTPYRHVPIMRVWNVSSLASDQHVYLQNRTDERGYDCTHFCENSGVFYYWREILYNILPLVIQHKEITMRKSSITLLD
eukprot:gene15143-16904_t